MTTLFRTTPGEKPDGPKWEEAEECSGCRARFSTLTRKHHCRNCGDILCANCSSYSHAIPNLGYKEEVRVCKLCKDELLHKEQTETIVATVGDVPVVQAPYHLQAFNNKRLRYVNECTCGTGLLRKKKTIAIVDKYLMFCSSGGKVWKVLEISAVERVYQQVQKKKTAAVFASFMEDKVSVNILIKTSSDEVYIRIPIGQYSQDLTGLMQRIKLALTGVEIPIRQVSESGIFQDFFDVGKQNHFTDNIQEQFQNRTYSEVICLLFGIDHSHESQLSIFDKLVKEAKKNPRELLSLRGRRKKTDEEFHPISQELHTIFAKYDPVRVTTIQHLLRENLGREEDLLEEIKIQYDTQHAMRTDIMEYLRMEGYDAGAAAQILKENNQNEAELLRSLQKVHSPMSLTNSFRKNSFAMSGSLYDEAVSDGEEDESSYSSESGTFRFCCSSCFNVISVLDKRPASGMKWRGEPATLLTNVFSDSIEAYGESVAERCTSGMAEIISIRCSDCKIDLGAKFESYPGNISREGCFIIQKRHLTNTSFEDSDSEIEIQQVQPTEDLMPMSTLAEIATFNRGMELFSFFMNEKPTEIHSVLPLLRNDAAVVNLYLPEEILEIDNCKTQPSVIDSPKLLESPTSGIRGRQREINGKRILCRLFDASLMAGGLIEMSKDAFGNVTCCIDGSSCGVVSFCEFKLASEMDQRAYCNFREIDKGFVIPSHREVEIKILLSSVMDSSGFSDFDIPPIARLARRYYLKLLRGQKFTHHRTLRSEIAKLVPGKSALKIGFEHNKISSPLRTLNGEGNKPLFEPTAPKTVSLFDNNNVRSPLLSVKTISVGSPLSIGKKIIPRQLSLLSNRQPLLQDEDWLEPVEILSAKAIERENRLKPAPVNLKNIFDKCENNDSGDAGVSNISSPPLSSMSPGITATQPSILQRAVISSRTPTTVLGNAPYWKPAADEVNSILTPVLKKPILIPTLLWDTPVDLL